MSTETLRKITDWYIYAMAALIDQIRSDQSQEIEKDQIRSDQSQSSSAPVGDWRSWLLGFCESEGISVEGKDLGDLERSVGWLRKNWEKIRNPRAYISKIISEAPDKLPEIVHEVYRSPEKEEEPTTEDTTIMGYEKEEIEAAVEKITDDNYPDLLNCIPKSSRVLFRNRDSVFSHDFKLNILAAYGLKEGVL